MLKSFCRLVVRRVPTWSKDSAETHTLESFSNSHNIMPFIMVYALKIRAGQQDVSRIERMVSAAAGAGDCAPIAVTTGISNQGLSNQCPLVSSARA